MTLTSFGSNYLASHTCVVVCISFKLYASASRCAYRTYQPCCSALDVCIDTLSHEIRYSRNPSRPHPSPRRADDMIATRALSSHHKPIECSALQQPCASHGWRARWLARYFWSMKHLSYVLCLFGMLCIDLPLHCQQRAVHGYYSRLCLPSLLLFHKLSTPRDPRSWTRSLTCPHCL